MTTFIVSQNTLKVAMYILRYVPEYGHKELLVVYNSLSTCDPGNVFETIKECKENKLRVSIICLAAEVYICKKITEETGGSFAVAIDATHLHRLLMKHTTPPPDLKNQAHAYADLIYMGFPRKIFETHVSYCFEGRRASLSSTSYVCPRCSAKTTDIPAVCGVCSLQLNSSSHIARSHHHLFPVPNFEELVESDHSTIKGEIISTLFLFLLCVNQIGHLSLVPCLSLIFVICSS